MSSGPATIRRARRTSGPSRVESASAARCGRRQHAFRTDDPRFVRLRRRAIFLARQSALWSEAQPPRRAPHARPSESGWTHRVYDRSISRGPAAQLAPGYRRSRRPYRPSAPFQSIPSLTSVFRTRPHTGRVSPNKRADWLSVKRRQGISLNSCRTRRNNPSRDAWSRRSPVRSACWRDLGRANLGDVAHGAGRVSMSTPRGLRVQGTKEQARCHSQTTPSDSNAGQIGARV